MFASNARVQALPEPLGLQQKPTNRLATSALAQATISSFPDYCSGLLTCSLLPLWTFVVWPHRAARADL